MKSKLYLTTIALILCSVVSFGQMANTQFANEPEVSDSADVVTFKFTTSLQQYIDSYILCRTVNGTTIEIDAQAGYEYMSVPIDYVFIDPNPVQGENATYELKMVDNMNSAETVLRTVTHTFTSIEDLDIIAFDQVYPNPVIDQLTVKIKRQKETAWLELRDLSGRIVVSNQISAGQQSAFLDLNLLTAGSYVLSLRAGNDVGSRMIVKH